MGFIFVPFSWVYVVTPYVKPTTLNITQHFFAAYQGFQTGFGGDFPIKD